MRKFKKYISKRTSGTKLLAPLGFEFTFEPKTLKNGAADDYIDEWVHQLRSEGHTCYNDSVLEINSPIFTEYAEDITDYYKSLVKRLGKTWVHKQDNSTGGGTHVHINLDGRPISFMAGLVESVINKPYLTYAFQDSSDDGSSEPFTKSDIPNDGCLAIPDNKNRMCSVKFTTNTLELRFFDTVSSIHELETYIKVVQYFIKQQEYHIYNLGLVVQKKIDLKRYLIDGTFLINFIEFCKQVKIKYPLTKILERMEFAGSKITPFNFDGCLERAKVEFTKQTPSRYSWNYASLNEFLKLEFTKL